MEVSAFSIDDTSVLLKCARALAPLRTIQEIADRACALARDLVGADGVCVVMREGPFVHYIAEDAIAPLWKGKQFPLEQCISGWVIVHAFTAEIPDIEHDARIPLVLYRSTFVRSLVMVPITNGDPFAAIGAYWKTPNAPTPRITALLEAFAKDLGVALSNAKQLDAEREARARAEANAHASDEFLELLGRELRNPLAPIVTALHLIKLRGTDPFARERAIVDRQVQHVVRLVDDLLDISRIARGAVQLRRATVELAVVTARAVEAVQRMVTERDHELVVTVPSDGLPVFADADRLTQVVTNLLANAVKFTPRGGRIELVGDVEDGCVRIVVRDTGVGIETKRLAGLFERWQVRPEQVGLGLGLAIVRGIVELHGGTVSAASRGPGRGAAFTVQLPLAVRASEGVAEPRREARSLHVLVVDDNVDAAQTLGELLGVMGHSAVVVHDAAAAVEAVGRFTPELAFLDIGLPDTDGYALAKQLHAIAGLIATPLVAVTGYGQPADIARSTAAGFASHLVKPLSLETLRATIAKLTA